MKIITYFPQDSMTTSSHPSYVILVGGLEHEFLIFPNSWDDDPIWRTHFFQRGWLKPPTRYGFRCQSWLIAGYPEVGLVRYRQLVRYRPESIDPFPTCKLAGEFPNAPYLIFLACVRQLSCRQFAPSWCTNTYFNTVLLWMKYMHMSLRGITLLKTSVFRFLFYPQSELIFVLLTSPLASPWRLPQGRFWFSILSFCCCEQAEIRAEFLNTSEAADAKRIPRVEVMCSFFIGNCMAWCLWWVQWDDYFKDIISIAKKCQKYKTVEIAKMISTVVHGAAVLSPRLLFLLFWNGLQPATSSHGF